LTPVDAYLFSLTSLFIELKTPGGGILSAMGIYRQRDGLNIDLRDVSLVLPNCSFFQYSTGQINASMSVA